jgi:hypothetical protein
VIGLAEWVNNWVLFLLALQIVELILIPAQVGKKREPISNTMGAVMAVWSLFITFCLLKAFGAI